MDKFKNFSTKYVKDMNKAAMGFYAHVEVQQHVNGTVVKIDTYQMEQPNYAFLAFESGLQVSVELKNGVLKIGTADEYRTKDLNNHPCFHTDSRNALLGVCVRYFLGRVATTAELEAIKDVLIYEVA
ncbi:TPA: hypothetical protein N1368_002420 [Salmonella enterica subsp. enterica serovar Agona]|nr:hypothetical protein [Salmonella enterica subsp. enterica serovar Agona]HCL1475346.1 hypothetical protein [Salmonella enterica subsp. enterica serovar Agona]HCL1499267.1 hypothetical protein [Salmonella enterica subsp. enterica serovar Derby]HCL1583127.1 hypothetical protein [Salmonella enterica subsp. enterica serovar Agona]HCL1612326.1 hypothetical protein [Salmonella enterica subsp. enterica serovar Agona]